MFLNNNILYFTLLFRLETSTINGTSNNFYEWIRLAKKFDMKEVVDKYSIRFKTKIKEVKEQMYEATIHNFGKKTIQILIDGMSLGLQTCVVVVVQHIRQKVLVFIKELVNYTIQSIINREISLRHWKDLQLQGEAHGVGTCILKDMFLSIKSNIFLEHSKIKRSIIVISKCNFMGIPIDCACETQRTYLNIKSLTLDQFTSHMYFTPPYIFDNSFLSCEVYF